MDYKKSNAPLNTVTRDLVELAQQTGNIYETVCVIAKRSNQIAAEMKHDLEKKLQEFASLNDNLEEISENREQIEISRYYEKLPNPHSSQPKSISTRRYTSATPSKTATASIETQSPVARGALCPKYLAVTKKLHTFALAKISTYIINYFKSPKECT